MLKSSVLSVLLLHEDILALTCLKKAQQKPDLAMDSAEMGSVARVLADA